MKHITTDELKQITHESLVLQGCGGDPGEWLTGINDLLTEAGILRDGDTFKNAYVFEHSGLTNILFDMEDVKLDIGKLAMWRLQNHGNFGGTWLSDYLMNKFGVEMAEREPNRQEAVIDNGEPEEAPPIVAFGERPSPYRDGFYTDGQHPDDRENATAHLPLRVYIENARDERLGGFTMPLPATAEALLPFLDEIEINGGQDIKVCEVLSDSDCLNEAMAEIVNKPISPDMLNELNYLAAKIDAMHPSEYETFGAALEAKRHCNSVAELINLTENLDRFELQPAFDAAMLGEHLLDGDADNCGEGFQKLYESKDDELRGVIGYIEILEKYVDYTAYGKEYAENEQGIFTDQGYLTESEGFKEVYRVPEDIPAEYRVVSLPEPEPLMKVENTGLTSLLLKMHALCGDYMTDANYHLNMLEARRSAEYLLLMDGSHIFLTEAAHAYRQGTEAFAIFTETPESSGTRAFAIHVTDMHDPRGVIGDLSEINLKEYQLDILRHSISHTRVDATPKLGPDRSFTPEEWDALEPIDHHMYQSWTRHFESNDQQAVLRHFESVRDKHAESGKVMEPDSLLSDLNRMYMDAAENPQPDMIRVTLYAAKEMLTHGDAAVYRLMPDGPKELSPLDAMQSRGGLWYQSHREFAVKKEDAAGIGKLAEREREARVRHLPEQDAPAKPKSHGQEL